MTAKHSVHMYECFVEMFTVLPLAFTINDKVFVTHGTFVCVCELVLIYVFMYMCMYVYVYVYV